MIFFDSASPMPGSCSRSSLEALLMSSCFFIGLPAPPLASGVSLLAGGLVVVPAASAIGTETAPSANRSEEHTSELQSQSNLVCRLLLEKKKKKIHHTR